MNIILPDRADPERKRPLEYFFKNLFTEEYEKPGIFGCWTEIVEKRLNPALEISGGETHWTVCNYFDLKAPRLLSIFNKLKIDTVFSVHADGSDTPFEVFPFPHYVYNIGHREENKNLLCSFVGEIPNHTRKTLFKNYVGKQGYYIKGKIDFHFKQSDLREKQAAQNYRDILNRSRFSACPRGFGPGTIRFWESLSYGAVPVLICDSCLLPPLWDWDKTIVRISEHDFNKHPETLDAAIKNISPEQEASMSKSCVAAFNHVFMGHTLRDYIRISLRHQRSVGTNTHLDNGFGQVPMVAGT